VHSGAGLAPFGHHVGLDRPLMWLEGVESQTHVKGSRWFALKHQGLCVDFASLLILS